MAHGGPAAGTGAAKGAAGLLRAAEPFPQPLWPTEPALDCGCSSAGLPSGLEIQPEPGSSVAHSSVPRKWHLPKLHRGLLQSLLCKAEKVTFLLHMSAAASTFKMSFCAL